MHTRKKRPNVRGGMQNRYRPCAATLSGWDTFSPRLPASLKTARKENFLIAYFYFSDNMFIDTKQSNPNYARAK
jgi:hypothetical protein